MLSTTRGTFARLATAAMAATSMTMPPGLARASMKIALVLSVTRASKAAGSAGSAHFTCQPKRLKAWLNWLMEPP